MESEFSFERGKNNYKIILRQAINQNKKCIFTLVFHQKSTDRWQTSILQSNYLKFSDVGTGAVVRA